MNIAILQHYLNKMIKDQLQVRSKITKNLYYNKKFSSNSNLHHNSEKNN